MDYEKILKQVRDQNPKMPYRDQQKAASRLVKVFKEAEVKEKVDKLPDFEKTGKSPDQDKPQSAGQSKKALISKSLLAAAEGRIRTGRIDVSSIISIGREVIPTGELVKHDKRGINTYVTFEDNSGNKLPMDGEFLIFL